MNLLWNILFLLSVIILSLVFKYYLCTLSIFKSRLMEGMEGETPAILTSSIQNNAITDQMNINYEYANINNNKTTKVKNDTTLKEAILKIKNDVLNAKMNEMGDTKSFYDQKIAELQKLISDYAGINTAEVQTVIEQAKVYVEQLKQERDKQTLVPSIINGFQSTINGIEKFSNRIEPFSSNEDENNMYYIFTENTNFSWTSLANARTSTVTIMPDVSTDLANREVVIILIGGGGAGGGNHGGGGGAGSINAFKTVIQNGDTFQIEIGKGGSFDGYKPDRRIFEKELTGKQTTCTVRGSVEIQYSVPGGNYGGGGYNGPAAERNQSGSGQSGSGGGGMAHDQPFVTPLDIRGGEAGRPNLNNALIPNTMAHPGGKGKMINNIAGNGGGGGGAGGPGRNASITNGGNGGEGVEFSGIIYVIKSVMPQDWKNATAGGKIAAGGGGGAWTQYKATGGTGGSGGGGAGGDCNNNTCSDNQTKSGDGHFDFLVGGPGKNGVPNTGSGGGGGSSTGFKGGSGGSGLVIIITPKMSWERPQPQ